MTRINAAYPYELYDPIERRRDKEIPFSLDTTASTVALLYLHEYGHAFTANLLYKNANPQITLTLTGGNCVYANTHLSELGAKLGHSNATALVASAGSIVEIITMLAITAWNGKDKRIARLMFPKALYLSLYALGGLLEQARTPSHDFWIIRNSVGDTAYGLLTALCLATTAIVAHNAFRKKQPEMQRAKYMYYPQTRRASPITYYPYQSRH
jgi:hypothetical protein